MAATAAVRHAAHGFRQDAKKLRVWELGSDDYLVGEYLPDHIATEVRVAENGEREYRLTFDVAATRPSSTLTETGPSLAATTPAWSYLKQACFSRIGNAYGWVDSCYRIDFLRYETDPRDFYKLEQYGTVGANTFGKIYSGFLQGDQASGSSTMAWIDWSPRGNRSGSCTNLPLQVSALGIPFLGSVDACEVYNIYKWADAGHFKVEWSCGCVFPLGQPYPNTRELDYMRAISVPQGGLAKWTLSAGLLAK